MRWLVPATALLTTLATSVHAEEDPACAQLKWPLATEKSWFERARWKALRTAGLRYIHMDIMKPGNE